MKDEQEEEEKKKGRIRAATHDGWMDGWGPVCACGRLFSLLFVQRAQQSKST